MSEDPPAREPAAPEDIDVALAGPGVGERLRASALLVARAGATVVTSTVVWAVGGAATSAALVGAFLALGWLDHPMPGWSILRYGLFLVLPFLSAWLCGIVGFSRGVGRVVLRVAIGEGALPALLLRSIDRVVELARRSELVDKSAVRVEGALAKLPVGAVQKVVQRAVGEATAGEPGAGKRTKRGFVARAAARFMAGPVEAILLGSLSSAAEGPGGFALQRFRADALAAAEDKFTALVHGVLQKKTALWLGVLGIAHALPPLLATLTRW